MLKFALAAVLLIAPLPAAAQVVSASPEAVAIVVYPGANPRSGGSGLVMVTERRTIDLPAGPVRISFRGVADLIVPQTAAIQGLPQAVLEQNFDYQLLTPGALIASSEGRTVRVTRTNPVTGQRIEERARVVSSQAGAMLDYGGRVEALNCSALPEKIAFDDLPAGYSDKPTLSVDLVSPAASRTTVYLSYLAVGVSWSSNYVARLRPDGRMDLSNWITIGNYSATSFPDAPVQVIAGRLERTPNATLPIYARPTMFWPNCWQIESGRNGVPDGTVVDEIISTGTFIAAPASINLRNLGSGRELITFNGRRMADEVEAEDLGDYKLYTLPERTTLAARQNKQLMMFDRRGVKFDRVYRVEVATGTRPVQPEAPIAASMIAELKNSKDAGLGLPLPAGTVTLFSQDGDGRQMFMGEDRVRDTAADLPLEFKLGASPQVQARVRITALEAGGSADVEVTMTNANARAVDFQLRETRDGAPRVTRESEPHIVKHGMPQWPIRLGPNQTKVLTYTLDWTNAG